MRPSAVPARVSGVQEWWLPFGAPSAGNHIAMYAQRHFHDYGTTREQMAQIPLVQRANAARYEKGIYRDLLTMDDYLDARMISEPFCLFDCDIPIDFCGAVVISRADATSGLRKPPLAIQATSTACRSRLSWDQFDDLSTMVLRDVGADLWQHTDLRPGDVDVAQVYDGFSFIAMAWLEALGFCGKGESGPFIEGGSRIALDGELPDQHEWRPALVRADAWVGLPARGLHPALGRGQGPPGPERSRSRRRGLRRGHLRRRPVAVEELTWRTTRDRCGCLRCSRTSTVITGRADCRASCASCVVRRVVDGSTRRPRICRSCLSRDLATEAVSGRATVAAFTINHQQWSPSATTERYVIAIVELPEQEGLRQTTNIVNCPVEDVYIGMPVRVVFEPLDDVAVPLFEPTSGPAQE